MSDTQTKLTASQALTATIAGFMCGCVITIGAFMLVGVILALVFLLPDALGSLLSVGHNSPTQ